MTCRSSRQHYSEADFAAVLGDGADGTHRCSFSAWPGVDVDVWNSTALAFSFFFMKYNTHTHTHNTKHQSTPSPRRYLTSSTINTFLWPCPDISYPQAPPRGQAPASLFPSSVLRYLSLFSLLWGFSLGFISSQLSIHVSRMCLPTCKIILV